MDNGKSSKKGKILIITIFMIIGLCLMINTNNNPNSLVQRVLRPIRIGTGTIYYAAVIPLLLIYYSIKEIYKLENFNLLNSMLKRIIFAFLVLSFFSVVSQNGVKLYKSFHNDLDSIYCYRNNIELSVKTTENRNTLDCLLDLENCSGKSENFYVKVKLPDSFKGMAPLAPTNSKELFTLRPRERRQFHVLLHEKNVESGDFSFSSIHDFDFSLFNTKQEVHFARNN